MAKRSKKRILVADDTIAMRIMLDDVLSEAGFEVQTTSDGEETWDRIRASSKEIDLLILDLLMPKISGFEILGHIRTDFPSRPFPILVITGVFKSEKEIQRLKELGAMGYINKSALVDEILFRVNSVFFQGRRNTRQHPRIIMSLPIDYQHDEAWRTNYSSTLSAGGMFIRTVAPLPSESSVFVKFKPPDFDDEVAITARVVWKSEYELDKPKSTLPGMGLSFQDMPREKQKRLDNYVREAIKKEPIWF